MMGKTMADKHNLVRDREAMLAGMTPVLRDGSYIFCITSDPEILSALSGKSLGVFQEDEGTALILSEVDAEGFGFQTTMPMARIVLEVFSALDGVGLTAGVATALADEGIPCNMVAAYNHDNVFVPKHLARLALDILRQVQERAARAMA
jgi:uncharacterized protein